MENGMSQRHRFFLLLHMRKSFFTDTFLKYRFRWKVEIISTFPLRTNVAFFLNQSFLSTHVNKVSHCNMAYSQSVICKMAEYFNLSNNVVSKGLLVDKFNMILDN